MRLTSKKARQTLSISLEKESHLKTADREALPRLVTAVETKIEISLWPRPAKFHNRAFPSANI